MHCGHVLPVSVLVLKLTVQSVTPPDRQSRLANTSASDESCSKNTHVPSVHFLSCERPKCLAESESRAVCPQQSQMRYHPSALCTYSLKLEH